MGFQDIVAVMPWTLILQICNLLLQIYLIKRFLLKPVQKIIKQRQEMANADLDAAAAAREEAEAARVEYVQSIAGAKEEAAALVRTATQTAQDRGDQIILQAKEEAAAIRAKASNDIAQEKKKVLNDAKNEISDIAMAIAEKVVGRELNQADQKDIIDGFIDELGGKA